VEQHMHKIRAMRWHLTSLALLVVVAIGLLIPIALWVPVRWERYVFPSIPLLAALSAVGWIVTARAVVGWTRDLKSSSTSHATE
jgi:drug/metabolite transporter (DMT)-like permease